jgi:hypothetical protein
MLTMVRRVLTKIGGGGGPLVHAADDAHRHTAYSGLACVSVERASRARANVEHKEFVTYRRN